MPKRVQIGKKKRPIFSFNVYLPITLSISGTNEDENKIKTYLEDLKVGKRKKSDFFRKFILKKMKGISGVNSFKEIEERAGLKELEIQFIKTLEEWGLDIERGNLSKFMIESLNKEMERFYEKKGEK